MDQQDHGPLARHPGNTPRNNHAPHPRGLPPPPMGVARTGYYGDEHVARIRLIQEMQAEGFNLKSIQRLIEGSSGAVEEALGFKRELLTPFGDEEPEYLTREELEERLGGPFDERVGGKAESLGLVRPIGGGRFEAPSPTFATARRSPMPS